MVVVSEEVRDALEHAGPVVALESTIIAHGLPYPDNIELARELEATIRRAGAVPATIAIIDGVARIGLDSSALELIGDPGTHVAKAGAADLAVHIARRAHAATTVSGTAFLAARAGIRIFATGGIGGVHRGEVWDVSCDLKTLADTAIAVISAGAKAILDLPRTLEALETLGVLVIGYRSSELPAFYTRESGLRLEHRADDPAELASLLRVRFEVLRQGGVLVANPIPGEAALDPEHVRAVIDGAIAAAERAAVSGKRLTPFLLDHIAGATGGAAVAANRALALSNAALAARVATAYAGGD